MEERRGFVRFKAPLYIKYATQTCEQEISGMAKDVSMGGIKIVLEKARDIPADADFSLFFLLPEKTLKVTGEIIWKKEFDDHNEAGIRFVNIPDMYKEDIYNHIFKYYRNELTKTWWQM